MQEGVDHMIGVVNEVNQTVHRNFSLIAGGYMPVMGDGVIRATSGVSEENDIHVATGAKGQLSDLERQRAEGELEANATIATSCREAPEAQPSQTPDIQPMRRLSNISALTI